jgi:hypothetical protein
MANIICLPRRIEAGTTAGAPPRPLMSSRQTYSTMRDNSRRLIVGDGNVIRFRPRGSPQCELGLESRPVTGDSPVEDLRKYEHTPESDDDFRHRTLINFLATIVVIVLMVTGSWMMDTIISSWPR